MTRKDFELIAKVMRELDADFNNGGEDTVSLSIVAGELARALATTNPAFNESRFLNACKAGN